MIQEVSRCYEEYKDSGIKWIGDIPQHWIFNRHKDNFIFVKNKCVNVSLEKVGLENIEGKTGKLISTNNKFDGDGVEFKNNDILFGKLRPYLAKVYLSEFSGNAVGDIFVYRPKKNTVPKFAQYLMLSDRYIDVINSSTAGAKMPRVSSGFIANLPVATPPLPEQKSIANYLDTKTAQIDKKIDLLTQKVAHYSKLKQALINETVTRGLDKTVPMKDSEVEWVGDVPEHWGVSAITNITSTISIKNHPKEELLSVYRDYGVIIKSMRDDNHNKAGANLSNYKLVEAGYLVINKMKAWQGSLGVSEFRGIVSPAYITCKTDKKIVERSYLHHLLRCRNYINEYNRLSYGVRVDQWDMRYDDFKYVPVLLPPKKEQKSIADYLDDKTAKIDTIVKTINTQIEHLKELRKTLINDVVTGQIKVI
ncbi:Type I restriction-modification system, specificity subunit S [uncultured Gammaproteobacteria bacterium]|nr:Type I restriction-modification system, specificity subunit S [uncultured Gammaproteobacteria bacterium]